MTDRIETIRKLVSKEPFTTEDCGTVKVTEKPLWYHKQGLSQTASGYGAKLNTGLVAHFNGKQYRIYCTIYSNAGTCWITVNGMKYFIG